MEIFEYLTGKAGLILLAFVVLCVFIYNKFKTQRYFKYIEKQRKHKDSTPS